MVTNYNFIIFKEDNVKWQSNTIGLYCRSDIQLEQ